MPATLREDFCVQHIRWPAKAWYRHKFGAMVGLLFLMALPSYLLASPRIEKGSYKLGNYIVTRLIRTEADRYPQECESDVKLPAMSRSIYLVYIDNKTETMQRVFGDSVCFSVSKDLSFRPTFEIPERFFVAEDGEEPLLDESEVSVATITQNHPPRQFWPRELHWKLHIFSYFFDNDEGLQKLKNFDGEYIDWLEKNESIGIGDIIDTKRPVTKLGFEVPGTADSPVGAMQAKIDFCDALKKIFALELVCPSLLPTDIATLTANFSPPTMEKVFEALLGDALIDNDTEAWGIFSAIAEDPNPFAASELYGTEITPTSAPVHHGDLLRIANALSAKAVVDNDARETYETMATWLTREEQENKDHVKSNELVYEHRGKRLTFWYPKAGEWGPKPIQGVPVDLAKAYCAQISRKPPPLSKASNQDGNLVFANGFSCGTLEPR